MSMAVIMAMGTAGSLGGASAERSRGGHHSEEITVTMMTSEASTQKFPTEGYVYDYIKRRNLKILTWNRSRSPSSDDETKLSTVLASGQMPDILGGVSVEKVLKYAPVWECS